MSDNNINIYNIKGLSCAACATSAQKRLSKLDTVDEAKVNYATQTAVVESASPVTMEELNAQLKKLGFELYPKTNKARKDAQETRKKELQLLKMKLIVSSAFALPLFLIAMFLPDIPYANYVMFGLTLPIIFWGGNQFFINAARQLSQLRANMDTLVALGSGTAFIFSTINTFAPDLLAVQGVGEQIYFEAAGVLLTFILLGRFLEERAKQNTSDSIEKLLALQSTTVHLVKNEEIREFPIEAIHPDDVLLVKPGEKVPLDGLIIEGHSTIDESMLTGESIPVSKKEEDQIIGGTINQSGSFQMRVEKVGEATLLAKIIRLVEDAQNSQAPIQKLVDKISTVFVPLVIILAGVTFGLWYSFGPEPLLSNALISAVTVLVIACPCALGLATPTAIMVGIGKGAQKGILIKDAKGLEVTSKVDTIVLDKTGTITEGKPQLKGIKWQFFLMFGVQRTEKILLSLESLSEHPLAQTLVKLFAKKGMKPEMEVKDFENIPGKGVQGMVEGTVYFVGNRKMVEDQGIGMAADLGTARDKFIEEGHTIVYFGNTKTVLGVLAFSDTVKPSSKFSIQQLQEADYDVQMLTGDNDAAARSIARQVGIKTYKAEVLPQDKIDYVQSLQEAGKTVAMIGDGVNDAPALAKADVGMAMNSGTDIAMDSADIILRHNDLGQIKDSIELSKATNSTIKQNLFWAFIYNLIGIPIAMGALFPLIGMRLSPMLAGAAMALSSVSVVLNSLRLYRKK